MTLYVETHVFCARVYGRTSERAFENLEVITKRKHQNR
jgi:hypothetical protein